MFWDRLIIEIFRDKQVFLEVNCFNESVIDWFVSCKDIGVYFDQLIQEGMCCVFVVLVVQVDVFDFVIVDEMII